MVPVKNFLEPGSMVALWNIHHQRFLKMDIHSMQPSPKHSQDMPNSWGAERFRVVDAGNGMVALHSRHRNRFVKLYWDGHHNQHMMGISDESPDTSVELPDGWEFDHAFVPVPIRMHLGHTDIALWNPWHHRFLPEFP
ncbi:unnamed protein product [Symbiodinium sp. CCMP2592]|nr:unnamed protein product [Symbiodinium sp. CCMP2592]